MRRTACPGLVRLIAAQHEHWLRANRRKWLRFKPVPTVVMGLTWSASFLPVLGALPSVAAPAVSEWPKSGSGTCRCSLTRIRGVSRQGIWDAVNRQAFEAMHATHGKFTARTVVALKLHLGGPSKPKRKTAHVFQRSNDESPCPLWPLGSSQESKFRFLS